MNFELIHTILILMVLLSGGFSMIIFMFWFLFKKDAPSYEEIRERFWVD
jgi:hypothetical protein